MRTALLIVFALAGVVMLASLLGGLLLLGSFAVTRARELHGSRREMDRQLADLLKERP